MAGLLCVVVALVPAGGEANKRERAKPARPNIVLIMDDDQPVNLEQFLTKTNAAIADKGVTLDKSFVNYSLCCPSRSTTRSRIPRTRRSTTRACAPSAKVAGKGKPQEATFYLRGKKVKRDAKPPIQVRLPNAASGKKLEAVATSLDGRVVTLDRTLHC